MSPTTAKRSAVVHQENSSTGRTNKNVQSTHRRAQNYEGLAISEEPSPMPTFLVHIVLPEGVNVVISEAIEGDGGGEENEETTQHNSDDDQRRSGDISGISVSIPREAPPKDVIVPSFTPTAMNFTTTTTTGTSESSQAPSDGPSMEPSSITIASIPEVAPGPYTPPTLPSVRASSVMASDFPSSIPSRAPSAAAATTTAETTSGEAFIAPSDNASPSQEAALPTTDATLVQHENELTASPKNTTNPILPIVSPGGDDSSARVVEVQPSQLSAAQTYRPSAKPIDRPSWLPSLVPSREPIADPTMEPTTSPSISNTSLPPSLAPSREPISDPTSIPTTEPTSSPPSSSPTLLPSSVPSSREPISSDPTSIPTSEPTSSPSSSPSRRPSLVPSREPMSDPTSSPTTMEPTSSPNNSPSLLPSLAPSREPISDPTSSPTTMEPTSSPNNSPTSEPMAFSPTSRPTDAEGGSVVVDDVVLQPSRPQLSASQTYRPRGNPIHYPSLLPSFVPSSREPISGPTNIPLVEETEVVVVDEVALYTTGEALMSAEEVSTFESVCETEFLHQYLPLVYSANYTEIDCTVMGQSMVEEISQRKLEQEEDQQQLQNAKVLLKSSTTNILVHVASIMNPMPSNDQNFEKIVAMTFSKYSEEFQALLSEQTSYFPAQPKNLPSDATEETQDIAINNDTTFYIVAVAIAGTILALGLGFYAIRWRRDNGKMEEEIEIDSLELISPRRKPDDAVPRFLVTCTSKDKEVPTNACETKDQAKLRASSPHSPSHTPSPQNPALPPLSLESCASLRMSGASQASSQESLQEGSLRTTSDTIHTNKDDSVDCSSSSLSRSDSDTPLVRRRVNYFNRITSGTGLGGNKRPPRINASVETDLSSLRDASFVSSRTGSRMSDSIEVASSTTRNNLYRDDSGGVYTTSVDYSCSDATSPRGAKLRHLSTVDITKSPVNNGDPMCAQGPIRLKSVKEDDALTTVTGDSHAAFQTQDSTLHRKQSPIESMLDSAGSDKGNERESIEPLHNNASSRSIPGVSGETSSISSLGGNSSTNFATILDSMRQFSAFGTYSNSSTAASATSRSETPNTATSSAPAALDTVESIEVSTNNDDIVTISHSITTVTSEDKNERKATARTTAHREPHGIVAATSHTSSAIMSSASNSSSAIMSSRPPRPPPSTGEEQAVSKRAVDKVVGHSNSSAIMSLRPPRPQPRSGGERAVSSNAVDNVVDLTELARKDHVGS
jgi:hypothetical protein